MCVFTHLLTKQDLDKKEKKPNYFIILFWFVIAFFIWGEEY
jgi:hypothetical protein